VFVFFVVDTLSFLYMGNNSVIVVVQFSLGLVAKLNLTTTITQLLPISIIYDYNVFGGTLNPTLLLGLVEQKTVINFAEIVV